MRILLVLLILWSLAPARAGSRLGENCFGGESGVGFVHGAVPLIARGTLEVADLEQVTAWLEKEFAPALEFLIDYDALGFNALARLEDSGARRVILNLGLILHPKVSRDVLALIGCHEVGHHLGGPPQRVETPLSYEGQADFFAPQACFDRWVTATAGTSYAVRSEVQRYCRALGPLLRGTIEKCFRTIEASVLLAEIFAGVKRVPTLPRLETQEIMRVAVSLPDHGTPQCRLDTFRNGFLSYQHAEMPRPACWFAR